MLSEKRIQAGYDIADYIHCPNVGPTYDIQRIQAAFDSVEYIGPSLVQHMIMNVLKQPIIVWTT